MFYHATVERLPGETSKVVQLAPSLPRSEVAINEKGMPHAGTAAEPLQALESPPAVPLASPPSSATVTTSAGKAFVIQT